MKLLKKSLLGLAAMGFVAGSLATAPAAAAAPANVGSSLDSVPAGKLIKSPFP